MVNKYKYICRRAKKIHFLYFEGKKSQRKFKKICGIKRCMTYFLVVILANVSYGVFQKKDHCKQSIVFLLMAGNDVYTITIQSMTML
jgi:hypothetical protein